jgi:hypothetical protein
VAHQLGAELLQAHLACCQVQAVPFSALSDGERSLDEQVAVNALNCKLLLPRGDCMVVTPVNIIIRTGARPIATQRMPYEFEHADGTVVTSTDGYKVAPRAHDR